MQCVRLAVVREQHAIRRHHAALAVRVVTIADRIATLTQSGSLVLVKQNRKRITPLSLSIPDFPTQRHMQCMYQSAPDTTSRVASTCNAMPNIGQ